MNIKARVAKLEIRRPYEPKLNDAYTAEQHAASMAFLAEALEFDGSIEELEEAIKNECGS